MGQTVVCDSYLWNILSSVLDATYVKSEWRECEHSGSTDILLLEMHYTRKNKVQWVRECW